MTPEEYHAAKAVFFRLCDSPRSQWTAELDRLCPNDAALRGAVEELLARDEALGKIESGARPSPDGAAGPEHPEQIGSYAILDVLGEGGMGVVYRAEQTEPIRRLCAIKLIHSAMASPAAITRFEAERRALALMQHPNVAQIFEAGTTEAGRPYFVMEYVPGTPISEHCDRVRADVTERLRLFRQVCAGIQHAHEHGIVHRDIKPANILVTGSSSSPLVKIIDFGVAKATDQRLVERTIYTEVGCIIGTPCYMSPEQAGVSPEEEITPRSDIYSLGVVLYELLVGELPLDRDTCHRLALDEVLRRIREDDPHTPSHRWSRMSARLSTQLAMMRRSSTTGWRHTLAGDLDWIVMRALEKDPGHRYATVADLDEDLRRHLAQETVEARPPSSLYRLERFCRRHRAATFAVTTVFLILIAALALVTVFYVRAERRREEAEWKAFLADLTAARMAFSMRDLPEVRRRLQACPQSLRGLEWEHLDLSRDLSLRRLCDHDGAVRSVTWLAGGREIATLDFGEVRISDASTGEIVWRFHGDEHFQALAASLDGDLLAFGSRDGVVRLVERPSGEVRELCRYHRNINALCFSPRERNVLAIGLDGPIAEVREIGPRDSYVRRRFAGHEDRVTCIAFSPDGERVASASHDGTIRIWSATSDDDTALVLPGHGGPAWTATFSPDGERIASGDSVGTIRIWDVRSCSLIASVVGHAGLVRCVTWSPDSTRLASASHDGKIRTWDGKSLRAVGVLRGHEDPVHSVAFGPDGGRLASGSSDRTVRVWDAETRGPVSVLRGRGRAVRRVRFTCDGGRIASAAADGVVVIRSATSGAPIAEHDLPASSSPRSSAIDPTASTACYSDERGTLHLVDLRAGRDAEIGLSFDGESTCAAFSPDGHVLASASADLVVRTHHTDTGRARLELHSHRHYRRSSLPDDCRASVTDLTFDAAGARLASACSCKEFLPPGLRSDVVVWDVRSGEVLARLRPRAQLDGRTRFSPDDRWLAVTWGDRSVRLFDTRTWEERVSLEGHEANVTAIAFTPDGRRLVTADGAGGTVRVWDTRHGAQLAILWESAGSVGPVAIDPAGSRIAVACDGGELRILESDLGSARGMWRAATRREAGATDAERRHASAGRELR